MAAYKRFCIDLHIATPAEVDTVLAFVSAYVKEAKDRGSEPDGPWLCSSPQPAEGHLCPDRLRRGNQNRTQSTQPLMAEKLKLSSDPLTHC